MESKKIENYEQHLRNYLEEYRRKTLSSLNHNIAIMTLEQIQKATREKEYTYKAFTLYGGKKGPSGKKEILHVLMPKEDLEHWDGELTDEGVPDIGLSSNAMYFCCKEIIDEDVRSDFFDTLTVKDMKEKYEER